MEYVYSILYIYIYTYILRERHTTRDASAKDPTNEEKICIYVCVICIYMYIYNAYIYIYREREIACVYIV